MGTLLVAGVGIHFLHALQMRRNTGSLLERANRAQEEGDLDQALTYYTHYLASEPGDTAARAKFGLVLDQHANNPGEWDDVVSTFKQVLERDPGRTDIRYRLVLNLIRLHRLREAMANVQSLLNSSGGSEAQRARDFPSDAELEHILAWCQEASGDYLKAAAGFGRAIKLDPRRVDSYVLLAEVLRNRLGQAEEAGKVMDDLVQANEQSFRALLDPLQLPPAAKSLWRCGGGPGEGAGISPQGTVGPLGRRRLGAVQGRHEESPGVGRKRICDRAGQLAR